MNTKMEKEREKEMRKIKLDSQKIEDQKEEIKRELQSTLKEDKRKVDK